MLRTLCYTSHMSHDTGMPAHFVHKAKYRLIFRPFLRDALAERHMSVRKFASLLGYSETAVRHWLSTESDQTLPHIEHCANIARVLDVPENVVREAAGHPLLAQDVSPEQVELVMQQREAARMLRSMSVVERSRALAILTLLANAA